MNFTLREPLDNWKSHNRRVLWPAVHAMIYPFLGSIERYDETDYGLERYTDGAWVEHTEHVKFVRALTDREPDVTDDDGEPTAANVKRVDDIGDAFVCECIGLHHKPDCPNKSLQIVDTRRNPSVPMEVAAKRIHDTFATTAKAEPDAPPAKIVSNPPPPYPGGPQRPGVSENEMAEGLAAYQSRHPGNILDDDKPSELHPGVPSLLDDAIKTELDDLQFLRTDIANLQKKEAPLCEYLTELKRLHERLCP